MRRRPGIGAIQKQRLEVEKYKDKSSSIQEGQLEEMSKQLAIFRTNLEEFARNHKNEIKKNAEFRRQFQEMCATIGVDPLASSKGFWSILGIGDLYYELSIQIIEVCLATSYKNGGIISLDELRQRLIRARGANKQNQEITNDDLLNAAKKLKIFGNGFTIINVGKDQYFIQSVPGELSMDHTALLQQVASSGNAYTSASIIQKQLSWEPGRSIKALSYMVKEGLLWVDMRSHEETLFWFPSLFTQCVESQDRANTI